MIHPNTAIQYLDIKVGEPRYKTINDLYKEYSHKPELLITGKDYRSTDINFIGDNINITELFGWTKLLGIRRIEYTDPKSPVKWYKIKAGNKEVIVSQDELIPFYDISNHTLGFHGEVKYEYVLKQILKSTNQDHIRLHNGEDDKGNIIEFDTRKIISVPLIENNFNYGYEINTRSKFFNGNDIHLYGSNELDIKELKKWYK